jgi:hypothetical protein
MCNRRTISETITGPATDALERSLKRPRNEKSSDTSQTSFYFPELYKNLVATVDGCDEAFPSISWNFDDESDSDDCSKATLDHLHPSYPSFMNCTKDVLNSLQRSKSFRTNLSDLNENPIARNQRYIFESNLEPIRTVDEDETPRIFPRVSNVYSDSQRIESDNLKQAFNLEVQKQDHIDHVQYSVGLDVL